MTSKSEILTEAYRLASEPWRWFRRRQQERAGTVPIVVLFYHRVADVHPTDWTISRSRFAAQMDWFQENFELLSMEQVHQRLQSGFNDRPAIAITFDDGYAENMDYALPLLAERQIPCMYYVSTSYILNQTFFPHDEKLRLQLHPNSVNDLKQILAWGLDIGAHTRTHPDVAQITDVEKLHDELVVCRRELMNLLEVPIEHFAFPYGQTSNISTAAVQMARRTGYKTVAAAYGGYNTIGGDPFFIQRVHGDPSLARIKNWTTLDPRWTSRRPDKQWLTPPSTDGRQAMSTARPTSEPLVTLESRPQPIRAHALEPVEDRPHLLPVPVFDEQTRTTFPDTPIISGR